MQHHPRAAAVLMLASLAFVGACSGADDHPRLESRYNDTMQLTPAEVRQGAKFEVTFAQGQVDALVMSQRVGEGWSEAFLLRDDGDTPAWTPIDEDGSRVDTLGGRTDSMTGMVPPPAAMGTYKLCTLDGNACALLEVID